MCACTFTIVAHANLHAYNIILHGILHMYKYPCHMHDAKYSIHYAIAICIAHIPLAMKSLKDQVTPTHKTNHILHTLTATVMHEDSIHRPALAWHWEK